MADNYDIGLAVLVNGLEKVAKRVDVPIKSNVLKSILEFSKDDIVERLVSKANELSLGMVKDEGEETTIDGGNQRLYSIFQNINIGKEYKKGDYYYPLVPINISDNIFPMREENFKGYHIKDDYLNLITCIESEVEKELGQIEIIGLENYEKITISFITYWRNTRA